jgi:hypothetical protein
MSITTEQNNEIIPPELALKAMRDSGYRNTAYALAELIDNSVQAEASLVEVFCIEQREQINQRERRRLKEIAVLDNGRGMNADVLRMALQFGNGTHLSDRAGIGRFGMGLPNASISQCRRVDVWTWQNGPQNALHSYLDVDEVEAGKLRSVPPPEHHPLPDVWIACSKDVGESGTLVLWQGFDEHRLTWKGARTTLQNTEYLVGRMYRKFLNSGRLGIRLVARENSQINYDRPAQINDPLYLLAPSSTSAPYDKVPMFQEWGEEDAKFEVTWNDNKHTVIVRISWAKPDTVPADGSDRGHKPYGKHAAKNIGVSIVRAGRELDLDSSWAIGYDPVERWWGIEIEFPPTLDEVFGVTNNKQSATIFSYMAQFDWKDEAEPGESFLDLKSRLRADGDPRVELIDISQYIHDQLSLIRGRLRDQTKGKRSGDKRHDDTSVEDRASTKFKKRAEQGHKTEEDEQILDKAALTKLQEDLVENKHYSEQVAHEIASAVEKRGRRVLFLEKESDSYAFFQIEQPAGITEIIFNRLHPAHKSLIMALDSEINEDTQPRDLAARIHNASDTLKMLFAAWARYEMEDVPNRQRIKDMRQEWGKMARIFLSDELE